MKTPLALGGALLVSTFLTGSGWAQTSGSTATAQTPPSAPAQSTPSTPATGAEGTPPTASPTTPPASATDPAADGTQESVDVSIPGADAGEEIVVIGRNIPEPVRNTAAVVNVLSTADIARTGEGDISGALQRVTGLSVVGQGFVYVRGLGDRYSLSLLNGSPLPSPEPLRRVVPLDIFPSRLIASALVQKSYSPNFPGEFGGGVINLTTVATPDETFYSVGASIGGDTETTAKLGYTYYGSDLDILGYDDGARRVPGFVRRAGETGQGLSPQEAALLTNAPTTLLQRNSDIPANFGADFSAGTRFEGGDVTVGVITSLGYSNSWQVRASEQQSTDDSAGLIIRDFDTVLTDNRILVNGLVGLGVEFGEHRIRLTNVYIHDTLKQTRLSSGFDVTNVDFDPNFPDPLLEQNTFFFERQLYDLQAVGEFDFGDLDIDVRGTYANTRRESPYERGFVYSYDREVGDYVNRLAGSFEEASIAFSDLDEDLYSGGIDATYELPTARPFSLTAGYAYTDTDRTSTRYEFIYRGVNGSGVNNTVGQLRPDYLLSDYTLLTYNVGLINQSTSQGAARYDAGLTIHAGYGQAEIELFDGVRVQGGVRYETADQFVDTFSNIARTELSNDYWLPALTVTWNFAEDMQLRLHGSKTIARPQFRELAPQLYQDFTSDRQFIGNPFLQDSEIYNAEARYEWFFRRGERITLAGFYKKLENPIEPVAFALPNSQLQTGFANAPEAELYGAEVELQTYVPLSGINSDFFTTRRLVLIGNYTYSQSELKTDDSLVAGPISSVTPELVQSSLLFRDGAPLTGQSDHLVNVQIGIEDTERLSQATLLFTYASDRVTNRGPVAFGNRLPDIVERPGIRLDFVAREAIELLGTNMEVKFEARNLTGQDYREFQQFENSAININAYDLGTSFSLGVSVGF
ncbi:outer membrane receptor protein involved in Fe transport [Sphingomonas jejuensis]|uniref:Outer membrane receptor protein involved in Fe transport n=1 Tax=Sphingomonas jejuensis TaxID=904715 RepID=A0ABX0XKL1_9SPHN|nr:TonB-dependent receptor [Sphingomonas jejuensis]NJC33275.1 outer membrane receptor protein involved in Fe transport [Sphingomonas jejuensis]